MNTNKYALIAALVAVLALVFCSPEVEQLQECTASPWLSTKLEKVDSIQPLHVSMSNLMGGVSVSKDSVDTIVEKSFKLYLTLPNQKEKVLDIVATNDTGDRGQGWGSYTPEKVESLYRLMFEPDTLLPDKKRGRYDTLVRISDSLNVNHYRIVCNTKGNIEAVFFKNETGCHIVWSWKDILESVRRKPVSDSIPTSSTRGFIFVWIIDMRSGECAVYFSHEFLSQEKITCCENSSSV